MVQVAFTIAMLVTVGLLVYVAFLAFSSGDDLSLGTHSGQSEQHGGEADGVPACTGSVTVPRCGYIPTMSDPDYDMYEMFYLD